MNPRHCLPLVALALVSTVTADPAPRNDLFRTLLGKSDAEVDAKIQAEFNQLFFGDDHTQRIFYPLADGTGYIADVHSGDVRTEGLSYGMMIAVQLDRKDVFDSIWAYAKEHLYHKEGPFRGYFAWHGTFEGAQLAEGPAPDGEEWFTMALFFAGHRWGGAYESEAQSLLKTMVHKDEEPGHGNATPMFDPATHLPVFAPDANASGFSDPSYALPMFYDLWAQWADSPRDKAFFAEAASASRTFWHHASNPRTGLMPDYADFDGKPHAREYHADFAYDAWRTLAYPGIDWAWTHSDAWDRAYANKVLGFIGGFGTKPPNRFTVDGTADSKDWSPGMMAMAAVAGLAADPDLARPYLRGLWESPIPDGNGRYYDGILHLMALMEAGGRFVPILPRDGH